MILELRDSQTGALLGRVVDQRETRDSIGMQQANRVTNTDRLPRIVQHLGEHQRQGDRGAQVGVAIAGDTDAGTEARLIASAKVPADARTVDFASQRSLLMVPGEVGHRAGGETARISARR